MFTKESLQDTIITPLINNLASYKELLAQLIIATLIIIAGWIIAKIIQIITKLILRLIHFDRFSDRTGFTRFLEDGGLHNIPSTTIANIFYWIILFISFTVAVNVFTTQSAFLVIDRLILFIPQAFLGLFIFIIGIALGIFFGKILQSILIRAGVREKVASFFQFLLLFTIVFASFLIGLSQLKVSNDVIAVIINNILEYTFIGLAIAFGLGGRFIASDIIAAFKLRRLYKRGSEIEYDNVKGVLKEIGWFDSLVYTEDGIVNIPNSSLARKVIKRKID